MCRKYFMSAVHKNTYIGQWRRSSCLCCPFPPPRLSSATAPSSPLKASHFPPSLYGSSPSPESHRGQDGDGNIEKQKYFSGTNISYFEVKGLGQHSALCVTLCERLEASTRSFSSFWMMRSLCAVALRNTCLAWRSLVLCWLCFSLYFLVGGAEDVSHRKSDNFSLCLSYWLCCNLIQMTGKFTVICSPELIL